MPNLFRNAAAILANATHSTAGEAAVYTQNGTEYAITAVPGMRKESVIGLEQDWLVKSSEVTVTPSFGDTLVVDGRTFYVFRAADAKACWRYSDSAGVQKRIHAGELEWQLVAIKRPATELGSRGQPLAGQQAIIASDVGCTIEPLSGQEREIAHQRMPYATHRVMLAREPSWELDETCWLELGNRRLSIGYIDDDELGKQYTLLCGESK